MAAGETFEQLHAAYPQLAIEDLHACLEYTSSGVNLHLSASKRVPH